VDILALGGHGSGIQTPTHTQVENLARERNGSYKHPHTHKWRILQGREMGQLVAEERRASRCSSRGGPEAARG
jgi:surfactin synthase thioesterase subunit